MLEIGKLYTNKIEFATYPNKLDFSSSSQRLGRNKIFLVLKTIQEDSAVYYITNVKFLCEGQVRWLFFYRSERRHFEEVEE